MALERAQLAASQSHFEKARDYEKRDQLDLALLEYRRVVEYQPSSQEARAAIQRLEQTIRDRIEAARPKPAAEAMRQQARKQMEEPALNPASREPVVLKFQNRQMKEILDFLGTSTGINVAYDKDFLRTLGNQVDQREHRRRDAGRSAPADPRRQRRVLQGAELAQHHRHRRQRGQARRVRRAGRADVLPVERRRRRRSSSC